MPTSTKLPSKNRLCQSNCERACHAQYSIIKNVRCGMRKYSGEIRSLWKWDATRFRVVFFFILNIDRLLHLTFVHLLSAQPNIEWLNSLHANWTVVYKCVSDYLHKNHFFPISMKQPSFYVTRVTVCPVFCFVSLYLFFPFICSIHSQ